MIIRFFKWIWKYIFGRKKRHQHCHHKTWKLIDKTILPTPYEQLMKDDNNVSVRIRKRADYLFGREVILTYECEETGEIKVVSTKENDDNNQH